MKSLDVNKFVILNDRYSDVDFQISKIYPKNKTKAYHKTGIISTQKTL